MQKLLHITFEPKPALEKVLRKEFDLVEIIFPQYKPESLDEMIRLAVETHKPDVILKEDAGSLTLKPETYKTLVDSKAQLFQWTQDLIEINSPRIKNIVEYAKVGVSLFSNYLNIDHINSLGYRADFLAPSVDFEVYNSDKTPIRFRDVSFIVNNYTSFTPLADFRMETVEYLEKHFGSCFHLFGANWFRGNGFVGAEKEAQAYSESLMSIGVSQYKELRYSSDRIYKAIGCKSLYLNYDYPGVSQDFPHIVNWKTLDDLKYIINYYKQEPEERIKVVNKAYEHLMANHQWSNRVDSLKLLIEKYK